MRGLRASLLSSCFAQLDAVRKLQRVWDELDAADGLAEERGGSGLTLVDSIGGSSTWSLWNRIAKKLEVAPPPSLIRGLYLFGQHTASFCCCCRNCCAALLTPVRRRGRHWQNDAHGHLQRLARARHAQETHPLPGLHARCPSPSAAPKKRGRPATRRCSGALRLVRVHLFCGEGSQVGCAGIYKHAQTRRRSLGPLPRRVHGYRRRRRHDPQATFSAPV